ncbi:MAG TPA: hypothetical protein VMA72_27170 [Streptosporangiaceae bacterium]|nr:hypothetical protein [Streptosporangiaceae bacterium]
MSSEEMKGHRIAVGVVPGRCGHGGFSEVLLGVVVRGAKAG